MIPLVIFFNLRFPVVSSENILHYALELCQAWGGLDKAIYCHPPSPDWILSADPRAQALDISALPSDGSSPCCSSSQTVTSPIFILFKFEMAMYYK